MLKVIATLVLSLFLILPLSAIERYPGQFAQQTQEEEQFFNKHAFCCSTADGVYAEEDIRNGGETWVRFIATDYASQKEIPVDWMKVPEDKILKETINTLGRPVVWWYIDPETNTMMIRCFVPGARV